MIRAIIQFAVKTRTLLRIKGGVINLSCWNKRGELGVSGLTRMHGHPDMMHTDASARTLTCIFTTSLRGAFLMSTSHKEVDAQSG